MGGALLELSVPIIVTGFGLLAASRWPPRLAVFIVGGADCRGGGDIGIRGALVAALPTATPTSRVEVLTGFFLGAYNGPLVRCRDLLAVRNGMPVCVVLAAVTAPVRAVTRRRPAPHRTETEHDPGR